MRNFNLVPVSDEEHLSILNMVDDHPRSGISENVIEVLNHLRKTLSDKIAREANLVDMSLDLENDVLLMCALEAHKRKITLNDMIVLALTAAIEYSKDSSKEHNE